VRRLACTSKDAAASVWASHSDKLLLLLLLHFLFFVHLRVLKLDSNNPNAEFHTCRHATAQEQEDWVTLLSRDCSWLAQLV
jgi:hypothetical protein